MNHLTVPRFLLQLTIMLAASRLFGRLARKIGQPSVLGELVAGIVLGSSVLGIIDPKQESIHLLAELGVILLLFLIGLETDLGQLLKVGGASAAVAIVGILLPFACGYFACRFLGLGDLASIVAAAALTATSVGITARVLAELGSLNEPEARIILGAAVLDDIIGLVILAVVGELAQGEKVSIVGIAGIAAVAFGFLFVTLLLGARVVPRILRWARSSPAPGALTIYAIVVALGLAWLADRSGSAIIIGAFAAGLLMAGTPERESIERGVTELGHFFVPIFFVSVGAAVDVRMFNPFDSKNIPGLEVGAVLIVIAALTKFASGYAPFWYKGRKSLIGAGMIPRGEVGLIFARMGLESGVFDSRLFSALTLMVMTTTFMAPPLLRKLISAGARALPAQIEPGWEELVSGGADGDPKRQAEQDRG